MHACVNDCGLGKKQSVSEGEWIIVVTWKEKAEEKIKGKVQENREIKVSVVWVKEDKR